MRKLWHRLKSRASKTLFRAARSRLGGRIVRWGFTRMSSFIPVDRLYDTDNVVAFHHPKPSHPVHVLIVPKKAIENILLVREDDVPCILDALAAVRHVVKLLHLEEQGYRLIVNGGRYQDVRQVHLHLVSGDELHEEGHPR